MSKVCNRNLNLEANDVQVNVPDAQLEQLDALEGSWARFRSCLDETANSLERAKDTFRDKLVQMVDTFCTDVVVSRDMFTQDAPYSSEVSAPKQQHCTESGIANPFSWSFVLTAQTHSCVTHACCFICSLLDSKSCNT